MPPAQVQELVAEIKAWYETHKHDTRQRDLAEKLGVSPTGLCQIFAGKNAPSASTALAMIRFLEENNMKTTYLDPRATPRQAASNPERPRTLSVAIDALDEANSTISNLRSEIAQLKGVPVAALPVKIVLPPTSPGQPRAAAPTTRQGIVADRTPEQKLPEKLTLPASATTPFLADEIIKVTPTESLRRMLDSEKISWRTAALYRAIKEREKLSTY
jgi:DNA-binding XRE family transcriptional regulator